MEKKFYDLRFAAFCGETNTPYILNIAFSSTDHKLAITNNTNFVLPAVRVKAKIEIKNNKYNCIYSMRFRVSPTFSSSSR